MSREHYDACFRYGIKSSPDENCNCYEFDRALEWVKPFLLAKIREEVERMDRYEWVTGTVAQFNAMADAISRSKLLALLTKIEGEMK